MIKNILVASAGTDADHPVFETALALAKPLSAHLAFHHARLSAYEAALRSPQVRFFRGGAVTDALAHLGAQSDHLSETSRLSFESFCSEHRIRVDATPGTTAELSAHWSEEVDDPERRLILRGRLSDLIVLGRHNSDLLHGNLIQSVLLETGRPLVLAPEQAHSSVTGTIVIGWRGCPESARALAAAMPLLVKAREVVVTDVSPDGSAALTTLDGVVEYLAWHGIAANCHAAPEGQAATAAQLLRVCASFGAELLVVGAYGHAPMREAVLGGVTRDLIAKAPLPVFLMH